MYARLTWTVGPDKAGFRGGIARVHPSARSADYVFDSHIVDEAGGVLVFHGADALGASRAHALGIWRALYDAAVAEGFLAVGWDRLMPGGAKARRVYRLEPGRVPQGEPYVFDWAAGEIRTPHRAIALSPAEADLFYLLDQHIERYVPVDRLILRLWPDGREPACALQTIRALVYRLRGKFAAAGLWIEGRAGSGYRLRFSV